MLAHLIFRAENKTVFDPREIATIKFQAGQGAINRSVCLGHASRRFFRSAFEPHAE